MEVGHYEEPSEASHLTHEPELSLHFQLVSILEAFRLAIAEIRAPEKVRQVLTIQAHFPSVFRRRTTA